MGTIIIKNSQVSGKVPMSTDLQVGELAVDTASGQLYTKHSDNVVKKITNSNLAPLVSPALTGTPTAPTAPADTSTTQLATTAFVNNVLPAGAVSFFARHTAPLGWLKANGAAVSRTAYAALFAAIGTTFGAGDGSTTFNLPDLRGEFIRSWDDGRTVDNGREFGTWQDSANKSHNHGGGTGGHSNGHHHKLDSLFWAKYDGSSQDCGVIGPYTQIDRYTSDVTANHWHGINSDGLAESRPRNIALLACIKY